MTVAAGASTRVGGVRIDRLSLDEAVARIVDTSRPKSVHLCNAYTIALASKDRHLLEVLERSQMNLADGAPVAWIARRGSEGGNPRRASGPDLMNSCLDQGREVNVRHFFFGSSPDVLTRIREQATSRWPGLQIAGMESPRFGDLTEDDRRDAIGRIEASDADVVWVGLGTPKQDFEVARLAEMGSATFIAVGAAFDFLAGTKRRAPVWMQRVGLEWVFRLAIEPKRLWRRYLVGNVVFLAAVLRHR